MAANEKAFDDRAIFFADNRFTEVVHKFDQLRDVGIDKRDVGV